MSQVILITVLATLSITLLAIIALMKHKYESYITRLDDEMAHVKHLNRRERMRRDHEEIIEAHRITKEEEGANTNTKTAKIEFITGTYMRIKNVDSVTDNSVRYIIKQSTGEVMFTAPMTHVRSIEIFEGDE